MGDNLADELFREVDIDDVELNPFRQVGKEWMLVTAGTMANWNTMTAAWGGFGFLWRKPVAFAFVRYNRYTYEFMEKQNHFSLSFFDTSWKKALMVCGTKSGRDTDKAKETGLRPLDLSEFPGVTGNALGFEQAQQMFICKKLYSGEISPEDFTEQEIHDLYPEKQYHRMYVGEIEKVLLHDEETAK